MSPALNSAPPRFEKLQAEAAAEVAVERYIAAHSLATPIGFVSQTAAADPRPQPDSMGIGTVRNSG